MKRTGIFETKDNAEEGFICGLPIEMNYAVMYEYAMAIKTSGPVVPLKPSKPICTVTLAQARLSEWGCIIAWHHIVKEYASQ